MDEHLRGDLHRVLGGLRARVSQDGQHQHHQQQQQQQRRQPGRSSSRSPSPARGYCQYGGVPLSRGQSLDRDVEAYYSAAAAAAANESRGRGALSPASPSPSPFLARAPAGSGGGGQFVSSVMSMADDPESVPDFPSGLLGDQSPGLSEACISGMIRGRGVPAPRRDAAALVHPAGKIRLMRLPCRTAGALLELALKREWTSTRLTEVALKLVDANILHPTLRFRRELEAIIQPPDAVTSLIDTAFNNTTINVFLYGHLMGYEAWHKMGVPAELLDVGKRDPAELLDFQLRFNMHSALSTDGVSLCRAHTREGLPSVEISKSNSVAGVSWAIPPQAVVLALAHLPNCSILRVPARNTVTYVPTVCLTFTSQFKSNGLAPSLTYLRIMSDAGRGMLPASYVARLRKLACETPDTPPCDVLRHRSLAPSKALRNL